MIGPEQSGCMAEIIDDNGRLIAEGRVMSVNDTHATLVGHLVRSVFGAEHDARITARRELFRERVMA